jgi:hypothetical protein
MNISREFIYKYIYFIANPQLKKTHFLFEKIQEKKYSIGSRKHKFKIKTEFLLTLDLKKSRIESYLDTGISI